MTNISNSLSGKVVAITRPEHQSREMVDLVKKFGGKPYIIPMIEITSPQGIEIDEFIKDIANEKYHYLIILSVNSVRSIFQRAQSIGQKERLLTGLENTRIFVIGKRTQEELKKHGIKDSVVAQIQSTNGVLATLKDDLTGIKIGIPRSSKGDKEIFEALTERGAKVTEVTAYESGQPKDTSSVIRFLEDLKQGKVHVVTFTSSSTAENMFNLASEYTSSEELNKFLSDTIVAAIGPRTQRTLETLGIVVDVVPEEHSIEAMLEAIAGFQVEMK